MAKGFLVGVTMGLAAPAVVTMTTADIGTVTATASRVATTATQAPPTAIVSSDKMGAIIGWGTGQSPAAVQQTIAATRELTRSRVAELAQQGLTRSWVENQLAMYRRALELAEKKLQNEQLKPRIELMERLLEYWPE